MAGSGKWRQRGRDLLHGDLGLGWSLPMPRECKSARSIGISGLLLLVPLYCSLGHRCPSSLLLVGQQAGEGWPLALESFPVVTHLAPSCDFSFGSPKSPR